MPRDTAAVPAAPAIHVRGGSLAYGGATLFDRLDVSLPGGAVTGLLGPSGVGKSSLVRLIAGLTEGASGTVTDDTGAGLQGRIAYMAQRDLLLPWLSALDNVLLGWRLRGAPVTAETRAAARDLMRRVGLEGWAEARPAEMSGGMRQRVALARTLMEDRPVVLMDEPFSGVDAITRHALQGLAAELLAGRTVLLVTHDPLEALRLSHRLLILAGRPAVLDDHVQPPASPPPRGAGDAAVLSLQAALLERLTAARERTG